MTYSCCQIPLKDFPDYGNQVRINLDSSKFSRYLAVNAVRDGIALLFIIPAIIPVSILMWRRERVPPMRLKHLSGLIFITAFGVVCAGNVLALLLRFAAPGTVEPLMHLPDGAVYLCFICFVGLLVPNSWIAAMARPARALTCYRLWQLEMHMLALTGRTPDSHHFSWHILWESGKLELAIYQAVIAVLDHYPALRSVPEGEPIYRQIRALVESKGEYPVLLKRMAAISSMMNEQTPDPSNRLAYWIGRIFHPYVLCVPVMLMALSGLELVEAVKWSLLVAVIVLVPAISLIAFIHGRGKFIHQRDTRGRVYITTWVSILICIGLLLALNAPKVLIAGLATLAVWTPLQMTINRYVTKISIHAAVTAGSATGCSSWGN